MNRGRAGSRDLAFACGLAGLGLIAALLSPGDWLQAVALAPLVLAVTGYAIAAALFPPGSIERGDRIVYSFVLSLSAAALGGLVLQVALDLDRDVWLALLVGLTLAAAAVAWLRRSKLPPQRAPRRPMRPPPGALWAVALLAAIAIAGAAVAIATGGVHEQQSRQQFASLWAVHRQSESDEPRVEIGVWNHGGPAEYRLEARRGGELLENLHLQLGPNRRWRIRIDPRAPAVDGPLLIALYRRSAQYRSIELDLGGAR